MVFTPIWATGFSSGDILIIPASHRGGALVGTAYKHTGTYGLQLFAALTAGSGETGYFRINTYALDISEIYFTLWVHPQTNYANLQGSTTGNARIRVVLNDLTDVSLRFYSDRWDAYVGSTKVAQGTKILNNDWHNVRGRVLIHGSTGVIQSKIDGTDDINFSGNTLPGTSTRIEYVSSSQYKPSPDYYSLETWWDDIVLGTGGWPNDLRAEPLIPNADTAEADWLLSSGSSGYSLVNVLPPNDTGYIYSGSHGDRSIFELSDWDGTGKDPQFGVVWVRAWRDSAEGQTIKLISSDGLNEELSGNKDLLTTAEHKHHIFISAPDSGSWTNDKFNNWQIGVETNISGS